MGQSSSRGVPTSERRRQRSSPSPRPFSRRPDSQLTLDSQPASRSTGRSLNPFTRLHSWHSDARSSASNSGLTRRGSRLSRAHSTISGIFDRHSSSSRSRDRPQRSSSSRFSSPLWISSSPDRNETPSPPAAPRLPPPDLDLDLDELSETFDAGEPPPRPPLVTRDTDQRSDDSLRSANSILDRMTQGTGPDRGGGRIRGSLRRRRSPMQQGEDNAAMLSRLLSVAAAATAATLMGEDHRAGAEARNFVGGDEDGTFDGFLQSLQNGRIASALRGNAGDGDETPDTAGGPPAPLNFFRMFRFGSSNNNRRNASASGTHGDSVNSDTPHGDEEGSEGRMVPIIIVGIRSINPSNSGSSQQDDNIPPFLDALSNFPTPMTSGNEPSIDGILRQPQNGTRFSHRRRASMGGLNNFPSTYDRQRDSRSPDRPRPHSTLSDTATGSRPPPSTPASSGLSPFSSGRTSPLFTPSTSTPSVPSAGPSRRDSFVRAASRTNSGLELPSEEHQPVNPLRTARQRRLSESDHTRFGAGSARRNGVVEPDHAPGDGPRSWIIYVLGGSYPENHPILTTPSLFTDTPTYEDMMLLSTLLGPAKPPVASESDVASAGGIYMIQQTEDGLIASPAESSADSEAIVVSDEQRCLVCLSEYEVNEEARRLIKCGHLFHRECIDQWLTTGRNSCPLCRGQGVDEHEQRSTSPASPMTPAASTIA